MPTKRPLVIVTRKLPDAIETRMMELFDVRLNVTDKPMTNADLAAAMAEADVLVSTVTDRIGAAILAQAGPNLRLIANFGAGVDHIDLASARQRGITVTNTPDVLTEDTADMALALILAVPRRLAEGERLVRSGKWTGWTPNLHDGAPHLGEETWHRRHGAHRPCGGATGARLRYLDPLSQPSPTACRHRSRPGGDLLGESRSDARRMDVISLHCPHTPATYHLLSARRLKLLQPHAYIVNTARGEVIDENALTRMLQNGEIAGAGLDVFEHEPAVNPKLIELDNVVLLPHLGSATLEGRVEMGEKVLINIKTFADGHNPPDRVLASML